MFQSILWVRPRTRYRRTQHRSAKLVWFFMSRIHLRASTIFKLVRFGTKVLVESVWFFPIRPSVFTLFGLPAAECNSGPPNERSRFGWFGPSAVGKIRLPLDGSHFGHRWPTGAAWTSRLLAKHRDRPSCSLVPNRGSRAISPSGPRCMETYPSDVNPLGFICRPNRSGLLAQFVWPRRGCVGVGEFAAKRFPLASISSQRYRVDFILVPDPSPHSRRRRASFRCLLVFRFRHFAECGRSAFGVLLRVRSLMNSGIGASEGFRCRFSIGWAGVSPEDFDANGFPIPIP